MLSCRIDERRIVCLTPFDADRHAWSTLRAIDLVIGAERLDVKRSGIVKGKQTLHGFMRNRGIVIDKNRLEMLMEALQIVGIQMWNGARNHLVHAKDRVPPLNRDLLRLVLLRLGEISGRCDELVHCFPFAKVSLGDVFDRCKPQTDR